MLYTLILGFALFLVGIFAMLTRKNMMKMILGFSIADTGIHIIIVSLGYLKNKTAPIIDSTIKISEAANSVVDPVPSALVLTAIVIGLATTALMLSFIVVMYKKKKSLLINDYQELKC